MINSANNHNLTSTHVDKSFEGLIWNIDMSLQGESSVASHRRSQAIADARSNRPRTAHIEREIMIAVVVLYAFILGSFAVLHVYGHYKFGDSQPETAVEKQSEDADQNRE